MFLIEKSVTSEVWQTRRNALYEENLCLFNLMQCKKISLFMNIADIIWGPRRANLTVESCSRTLCAYSNAFLSTWSCGVRASRSCKVMMYAGIWNENTKILLKCNRLYWSRKHVKFYKASKALWFFSVHSQDISPDASRITLESTQSLNKYRSKRLSEC